MDKDNKKGTSSSKNINANNQNINMGSEIFEKKDDILGDVVSAQGANSSAEYSNNSGDNASFGASNNSSNFNYNIAVLNELSKACQLAMNNISYISEIICNKKLKQDLVAIYSQYANVLLQVDQHFEKYGEIPANVSNGLKTMGMWGIKMNTQFDRSNSKIAEIMIQGENMGIIKCQKVLNANLDIEQSTIDLLNSFKNFQKENISKLSNYL